MKTVYIVSIGFLLCSVFIGVALYLRQTEQPIIKKKEEAISQISAPEKLTKLSSPEPKEILHKDWKSTTMFGVTFQHPSTWFVNDASEKNVSKRIRIQNFDPKTGEGGGYIPTLDKGKLLFQIDLLDQAVDPNKQGGECYYMGNGPGSLQVLNSRQSIIGKNTVSAQKSSCLIEDKEAPAEQNYFIVNTKGKAVFLVIGLDENEGLRYITDFLETLTF